MADTEQLKTLKENLTDILKHDPLAIGKDSALGAVNFAEAEPLFKNVNSLALELDSLPFEELPTGGINWANLSGVATNVRTSMNEIASFTLSGRTDPEGQRNSLVSGLNQHYDAMLNAFLPYIPYLTLRNTQAFEVVKQSKELLTETKNEYDNAVKHSKKQKQEVDDVVQAAKDAAAKIGVARFATSFETIAANHEFLSKVWLGVSGLMGMVTLAVTGLFIKLGPAWPKESLAAGESLLPFALTKLALLSVLYFVTIWTGRNYKAHRHLGVVNRHRQNALSTFETFVSASNDDQTKDAVLLEATRCIFSPTASGYLGAGLEQPPSRLYEIIKSIGKSE